ncbi:MAG: T9SS type A sorting domain-containing protein [Flavobacteriaceae bacterium]|nr:T9SS type A sorting domain-containing protein [Flavobacteriaceae bacterium]
MKKKHSLRGILLCLFLLYTIICNAQSIGDIAFIAFNTDGDKDFAIVVLTDITPNATIYFTDDETNGSGGFIGSEGIITWSSGSKTITAGTVVIFTDIDHHTNPNFNASIGSITRSGSFSLSGSKDGIIAYTRTNENAPITYLAAIQIGNADTVLGPFDGDGITLTNTGLTIGSTIVVINNVASPDGGKYSESRSNKTVFSDYLASISDKTKWTTVSSSGDGETLLPYAEDAFTIKNTNWTGTTSTVWNLAENWDNGIPTSSSFVTIPNVATSPIIGSGTEAEVGNLTINAGETVTLNSENSITIYGTLTIAGGLNGNSGSSIIVKGTSSGNLSYSRNLTTNWHLISSPVSPQGIYNFAVTNIATNSIGTSGSNYGIAQYNNDGSAWVYYTTSTIIGAGNFIVGKGYATLRTSSGVVTFKGTIATREVAITITDGTNNKWNLIGNPYPSYISANSNADATNNFLSINTTNINATFQALYFWDGSEYIPINQASSARFIAPGQGFFVNAITNGSTIDFTEAMQSHQTMDVFSKSKSVWPEITLQMTAGATNKHTKIKYITGTTTGLDPGYDAGMFTGTSNTFSVYTHLVTDSDGTPFSLQALPDNEYENIIVPIGFNAISSKEITFSINHQNLPSGLMVFIEDITESKITRIDESNSAYKITINSDNNGIGRLYLRTSTSDLRKTLDIDDFFTNQIKMYITSNRTLRITGIKNAKANIILYDILGKRILDKNFSSNSMIDLAIPNTIKSGFYIVKLETKKGNIHKKIFIK